MATQSSKDTDKNWLHKNKILEKNSKVESYITKYPLTYMKRATCGGAWSRTSAGVFSAYDSEPIIDLHVIDILISLQCRTIWASGSVNFPDEDLELLFVVLFWFFAGARWLFRKSFKLQMLAPHILPCPCFAAHAGYMKPIKAPIFLLNYHRELIDLLNGARSAH